MDKSDNRIIFIILYGLSADKLDTIITSYQTRI